MTPKETSKTIYIDNVTELQNGVCSYFTNLKEDLGSTKVDSPDQASVILALGGKSFSKYSSKPFVDHVGYLVNTPKGVVIPCVHPNDMYKYSGNRIRIEKAFEKADNYALGEREDPENLIINENKKGVLAYLADCLKSDEVCIDLETDGKEMTSKLTAVGISKSPNEALCFSADMYGFNEALEILSEIMKAPHITKIGQNLINFDAQILHWAHGMSMYGNVWDTLDTFKIIYPDLIENAGLNAQGSLFLLCEAWKDEAWKERGVTLRKYCAKDVIRTYRIKEKQKAELNRQGSLEYHKSVVMPVGAPLARAINRGIDFDHDAAAALKKEFEKEESELYKKLQDLVRPYFNPPQERNGRDNANDVLVDRIPAVENFQKMSRADLDSLLIQYLPKKEVKEHYLAKKQDATRYGLVPGRVYQKSYFTVDKDYNPGSSKQTIEVFQNTGIDVPQKRKPDGTWGPAVGKLQLQQICFRYPDRPEVIDIAKTLLEYSPIRKFVTGYLNATFPPDGRWRSQFKLIGTETNRASSQKYFGTYCGNLQNIPSRGIAKVYKKCFVAPPGYKFFNFDQDRAETYIQAYLSESPALMRILEQGVDFHAETARLMFNLNKSDAELKGTDEREIIAKALNHCLSKDHDVLTPQGWVPIADWNGQKIMTYSKDGSLSFTKPLEYYRYGPSEGYRFTGKLIDTHVTPNHRFPTITSGGNIIDVPAEELAHLKSGNIPCSGVIKTGTLNATANEFLEVAIQADGHIYYNKVVFHFKSETKIKRLTRILELLGIEHQINSDASDGSTYIIFDKSKVQFNLIDENTDFRLSAVFKYSKQALEDILDEVFNWDGHVLEDRSFYNDKKKTNCEFVQTLAHLTDQQAGAPVYSPATGVYRMSITARKIVTISGMSECAKEKLDASYCFKTETGYFLVRTPRGIYVTGNSNAYDVGPFVMSTIMMNYGRNFDKRQVEKMQNAWHKAYPEIRAKFHKYVESCIEQGLPLVNPLGRARYFYNHITPREIKQAYADIPQSTVPAISNLMWKWVASTYKDEEAMVLIQTHDSISGIVREDLADEFVQRFVKAGSEIKLMINGRTFNIPWSGGLGDNYKEAK